MRIPIYGLLRAQRSRDPISQEQEKKIRAWWNELGGLPERLVIDRASGSRCRLDEAEGIIHIGSDINPGPGTSPNASLRWRAALAHEYRHLQRFDSGNVLPPGPLDEAITDLEACAFPQLTPAIREELTADALQRLYEYTIQSCQPNSSEKNTGN
ncbi:MAG: hypothetical protein C4527_09755 [Candidatus Omnitrophota bacterium]|jgi:hypothetical protein|nr:MAG: hypothetical protein C4527_09755 [Candidatus Omnitrophota bacterium]